MDTIKQCFYDQCVVTTADVTADVTAGPFTWSLGCRKVNCSAQMSEMGQLGGGGQLQLDLIQMDDYFSDSCTINPTAFFFFYVGNVMIKSNFSLAVYDSDWLISKAVRLNV